MFFNCFVLFSNVSINDFEAIRSDFLLGDEADEYEVINWTEAFDNEQPSVRQCTCSCHQESSSTSGVHANHCGLCFIKVRGMPIRLIASERELIFLFQFFNGHAYIWRGSRLVRAQIELLDYDEPPTEVRVVLAYVYCGVFTYEYLAVFR